MKRQKNLIKTSFSKYGLAILFSRIKKVRNTTRNHKDTKLLSPWSDKDIHDLLKFLIWDIKLGWEFKSDRVQITSLDLLMEKWNIMSKSDPPQITSRVQMEEQQYKTKVYTSLSQRSEHTMVKGKQTRKEKLTLSYICTWC